MSKDPEKKEVQKFAVALAVFLVVIGLVRTFFGKEELLSFCSVALVVLVVGMFFPRALRPVFLVFQKISFYLGAVNTKIILGVFFYLFMTPLGLFLRLIRKEVLQLNIQKEAKSYWIKNPQQGFTKEDFKNQF